MSHFQKGNKKNSGWQKPEKSGHFFQKNLLFQNVAYGDPHANPIKTHA
jgi:hypothetical protein